MCGFVGIIERHPMHGDVLGASIEKMGATLTHRGPDDAGIWLDPHDGIALGHRRLAILDLSPQGRQPMVSHCGRYVLAFNGEIYNYRSLRQSLDSEVIWRGTSDTEVLLSWIALRGVPATLKAINGMFAFALWDRAQKLLTLARDRFGEKPLYYGSNQSRFLFGSELKALAAHPGWRGEIDRSALAAYLRFGYIPAPASIYQRVHKLEPGTYALVPWGQASPSVHRYWSAQETAVHGLTHPFAGTEGDASQALETLLSDAVRLRMHADVPLGAFLSGGIDSSTIVALMQRQSSSPVRTFSIGFNEQDFNEAIYARRIAEHLGTEHSELYVTGRDCLDTIDDLPRHWDEPFADASQIPMLLLSALAREEVTVCLSGDGGDELFGGYSRYLDTRDTWRRIRRMPERLRRVLGGLITGVPASVWSRILQPLKPFLPDLLRIANPGDRIHKAVEILNATSAQALYRRMISHWKDPASIIIGATERSTVFDGTPGWPRNSPIIEELMYMDTMLYLPDDILVKVDRATMAVGLEARVPILDHRVYQLAWSFPLEWKVHGRNGKRPLRRILERHVPRGLIERPKMGFGVPTQDWLRGPLRDWAESYLSSDRLQREGVFHPGPIRAKWMEHLSGGRNWSYYLWDILMFEVWLEHAGQVSAG